MLLKFNKQLNYNTENIITIKEINELIESDYIQEDIHNNHDGWFPLMKYDEDYGITKSFDAIQFLTVGLNPSLTNNFKEHIHSTIFEIKDKFDPKSKHDFGRKDKYVIDKEAITKKLIDYQALLKYDNKEQIPYFKHLKSFFEDINKEISFKDHVFHYDFCQLRHTNSKEITNILNDKYEYFAKHFNKIIEAVNPEYIFVFNASLSRLLIDKDFFSSKTIHKESGCYYLKDKPGSSPKVILANQLSGGATSSVYKELLIWNVNRIINK